MTQPNGGAAFPRWGNYGVGSQDSVSLQAYAAIKLRVPESGIKWLDAMIRRSNRNKIAAMALNGWMANVQCDLAADVDAEKADIANACYELADAMLAEGSPCRPRQKEQSPYEDRRREILGDTDAGTERLAKDVVGMDNHIKNKELLDMIKQYAQILQSRLCCYTNSERFCDCKFMTLNGKPHYSSETTGCCEARNIIRIIDVINKRQQNALARSGEERNETT